MRLRPQRAETAAAAGRAHSRSRSRSRSHRERADASGGVRLAHEQCARAAFHCNWLQCSKREGRARVGARRLVAKHAAASGTATAAAAAGGSGARVLHQPSSHVDGGAEDSHLSPHRAADDAHKHRPARDAHGAAQSQRAQAGTHIQRTDDGRRGGAVREWQPLCISGAGLCLWAAAALCTSGVLGADSRGALNRLARQPKHGDADGALVVAQELADAAAHGSNGGLHGCKRGAQRRRVFDAVCRQLRLVNAQVHKHDAGGAQLRQPAAAGRGLRLR